ncbi:MAG: DUF86 domain-containing protein [Nitrospirae bacterium]|nr:DUF86 domain-containing protein [Nitrospirota bacterium]
MHKVLFRKLERLKEEVLYLEINRTKFLKGIEISKDIKKQVERSVYLCAEIALDIADMVIATKGLPKPSTYSDSIYKLGDYKIIPKDFVRKFIYIAGLRNFLAHDYEVDTILDLRRFLSSGIKDIKRFIGYMENV